MKLMSTEREGFHSKIIDIAFEYVNCFDKGFISPLLKLIKTCESTGLGETSAPFQLFIGHFYLMTQKTSTMDIHDGFYETLT